ncbi:MAG: DNA repair protein RecN [Lachnospiraceae bacterium]|nr:DNA repair protein RecN [Lachnospiraceae bacterium]
MLVSLHVKNLALIQETEVWFGEKLNILTGETGAGKSIIIGSISLALGAKADKDLIRNGAEYALVELTFQVDGETAEKLRQMELPVEEDGEVLLTRRIMPTRSICRFNGETVSVRQVQELSGILVDIHGQHEHQSLLHARKHFEILDDFCGEELSDCKQKIGEHYTKWQKICSELSEGTVDERERQRELSLLQFELEEIDRADLKEGEDEQLEADYRRMSNARKIAEAAYNAYHMTGYEQAEGAGETLGRAVRELSSVAQYDGHAQELAAQLMQIDSLLNDFNRELSDYLSELSFDEQDFKETEERLNEWNRLKDKYGKDYAAICAEREKIAAQCEKLADYTAYQEKLELHKQEEEAQLQKLCEQAGEVRRRKAEELAAKMTEALVDLNFLDVQFEIAVRRLSQFTREGTDEVEFMISTNPGEPMKPLGSVASGGELSRIMLALKTVLADKDATPTMIFDEIDAGISGRTAWKVSQKLALLAKRHQIICITHLPQIAAMADTHFVIEKQTTGGSTTTQIRELLKEEELEEISRLLGGIDMTEAVLDNAKELKNQAKLVKADLN